METRQRCPSPTFSRDALRELDRRCVEEFGIPSIVLMENAAIGMCDHTLACMRDRGSTGALIVAGAGNNGGDGLALARHLHIAGADVGILMLRAPRHGTDAWTNFQICQRLALPLTTLPAEPDRGAADRVPGALARGLGGLGGAPVLIDALLGTGLDRDVVGPALALIDAMNASPAPVIAADLPSGMDADSGSPRGGCVRAELTCTFAGFKRGFSSPGAGAFTGRVELCPIGAPPELVERLRDPG